MSLRSLYPATEPRRAGHLPVGDGHAIYFEEAGNPDGVPVVFLHGGPGGGCKPSHRAFFHPARYRSVIFDQRGAGRSTPYAEVAANTTWDLVADMETLRKTLGIERWLLFGGSWGAALALAYMQSHPARVLGMVLRGSFLARRRDLQWFLGPDGAARLLPRAWHSFCEATHDVGQDEISLHAALFGPDEALALRVAHAWAAWSGEVVMYAFDSAPGEMTGPDAEVLGKARIELHYARHSYFLGNDQLLKRLTRDRVLPSIPVMLIHGQRDITCPPESAWALHQALPGSTLEILRSGGHLSGEAVIQDALLRAADAMADTLGAPPA